MESTDLDTNVDCVEEVVEHEVSEGNFTGFEEKVDLESFHLLKVLGSGAYGKVFLVKKMHGHDAGCLYAMKVLKKAAIVHKPKTAEHTITERQVLESVRQSPFLVTLHYAFQTNSRLHLILDYVSGGELFTHLSSRGKFTEAEVRIYAAEILLAIQHLHDLGIIYRDLKLENILLDSDGHIVLTDFGLSKEFINGNHRTFSFCGTIEYMAPEVVRNTLEGHSYSADVWSFGVLVYELLTGASPFTVQGTKNDQKQVSKRILTKSPPIPRNISKAALDLILKLLVKDPKKRLGYGKDGINNIKAHIFWKGLDWNKLLQKKIQAPFKPVVCDELDTRNFAEEFTKQHPLFSPAQTPAVNCNFKGYSFVSPNVMFGRPHVLTEDLLDIKTGCPSPKFKSCAPSADDFFSEYYLDMDGPPLGDGSYSVCRRCVELSTGQQLAVKIVSSKLEKFMENEIKALEICKNHPNIVKLHKVYKGQHHTFMIMELLRGGELLQLIRTSNISEQQCVVIMKQIVSAVCFMHHNNIVHRDIKPENIIFVNPIQTNPPQQKSPKSKQTSLEEGLHLKIVDFGFSRGKPTSKSLPMATPLFTLHYAAPEVLENSVLDHRGEGGVTGPHESLSVVGYDENCDLWSIGVIMYALLSGEVPFVRNGKSLNAGEIIKRIKTSDFCFKSNNWKNVSQQAKHLVKGLLVVNPRHRLKMHQVINHPWIQQNFHGNQDTYHGNHPSNKNVTTWSRHFNATLNAYKTIMTSQFKLASVGDAKLAKRRHGNKRRLLGEVDATESSSGSSRDDVTACSASTSSSGDGYDVTKAKKAKFDDETTKAN